MQNQNFTRNGIHKAAESEVRQNSNSNDQPENQSGQSTACNGKKSNESL